MLKRNRTEAAQIVSGKFGDDLLGHVSQFLISQYQKIYSHFCENCHRTGYQFKIKDGQVVTGECICRHVIKKNKYIDRLFKSSNIPPLYQRSKIDKWNNMGSNHREQSLNSDSFQTINTYAQNLVRMREKGYGLFLCGPNGVGKTYLACAVGSVAIKSQFSVKFYTMAAIIQMQIKGWFHEDAKEAVRGICDSDYLIIDDLDKIYRTKTGIETSVFDNLLRERLQRRLPCIFTSNKTLSHAKSDYSDAIHSMLLEQCAELVFVGSDHRSNMSSNIRLDILNGD